jgi:hypothetical protein
MRSNAADMENIYTVLGLQQEEVMLAGKKFDMARWQRDMELKVRM